MKIGVTGVTLGCHTIGGSAEPDLNKINELHIGKDGSDPYRRSHLHSNPLILLGETEVGIVGVTPRCHTNFEIPRDPPQRGNAHDSCSATPFKTRPDLSMAAQVSFTIHRNLRPSDLFTHTKALIIARVLTAESDKVFDAIDRNYLTKSEARAWMTQVAQAEMAKLEKLQLIQKMDGSYDDEDRRLDWAHRKAWRLLSDRGVEASLDQGTLDRLKTEGASEADLEALENTLELLSCNLLSEAATNRQRREFLELTGRVSVSAYEMLQLRQLTSAAKAATWERFETSPPRPAQDMAEEIARELGSFQLAADVAPSEGSKSDDTQNTAQIPEDVAP